MPQGYQGAVGSFGTNYNSETMNMTQDTCMTEEAVDIEDY